MDDKVVLRHEPIRILQVVTVMNRAGLETMLMNYYRNIDRTKIQFDFLVHRDEKGDYDDEIMSLGGRIYHLRPISLKSMLTYQRQLAEFFQKHSEYRVVHSHLDALSALPLSAAKKAGIPMRIAHSHTSNFDKDAKIIIRYIAKLFIRRYATDFLGCSEAAVHFMFGNKLPNYMVVNNAIDPAKFRYSPSTRRKIRSQFKLEGRFVIGHVGRFNYPKNHEFLIDIFKEVHDRSPFSLLMLVGSGEGEDTIKEKVHELGLDDSVEFLGLRTDIPDLMQAMDVFVMPSRYEGLPVVSVEAQTSGLPCIFSDVVTAELDVTKNCLFLSLDASLNVWANSILEYINYGRTDTLAKIRWHGYDVGLEAEKLSNLYSDKVRL